MKIKLPFIGEISSESNLPELPQLDKEHFKILYKLHETYITSVDKNIQKAYGTIKPSVLIINSTINLKLLYRHLLKDSGNSGYYVNFSDGGVISQYFSETTKNIDDLFELFLQQAPAFVFFDNIHLLTENCDEGEALKNLIHWLKKVKHNYKDKPLYIIARSDTKKLDKELCDRACFDVIISK